MKKLTMLFLMVFAVAYAIAQEEYPYQDDEFRTVFSKNHSNGAYGAVSFGYSQIDGQNALTTGARAMYLIDHVFAVGVGGYGFVNNLDYHNYINNNPLDYYLAGGYGGIYLEPIIGGNNPVHFSFPVLFGVGGVALIQDFGHDYWGHYSYGDIYNDAFFVVEPAVELEFNLARFFRAAAQVSYRFTSNIQLHDVDQSVLSGFNFGATFKFGVF